MAQFQFGPRGKVLPFPPQPNTPLIQKWLGESGLTPAQLECYQVSPQVIRERVKNDRFPCSDSIAIIFRDPSGKQTDHIHFRVFGNDSVKYVTPKGEKGVHIYYPTGVSWLEVIADPKIPIIIVEGEKKATKICNTPGWPPAIGLEGIWSYANEKGTELCSDLQWGYAFWHERVVYIVYDSDQVHNSQIRMAQHRLCHMLVEVGAKPLILYIHSLGSKAKGADDYIVAGGIWSALEKTADGNVSNFLEEIANSWAFDTVERCIWGFQDKVYYDKGNFKDLVIPKLIGKHGVGIKPAQLITTLFKHPKFDHFHGQTFEPGAPAETLIEVGRDNQLKYNKWRGWGVEDAKTERYDEDVGLLWAYARGLVGSEDKARMLINWTLWPMAHPEYKQHYACIMVSAEKGVGKSRWGLMAVAAMDPYSAQTNGKVALGEQFNAILAEKVFVQLDELELDHYNNDAGLKAVITEPWVSIRRMRVDAYVIPNYANLYITSNKSNIVRMDDNDRRYLVFRAKTGARGVLEKAKQLLADPRNVMWYARHKHDFKGWEPQGPAPMTEDKIILADATRPEYETAALGLRDELAEAGEGPWLITSDAMKKWLLDHGHGDLIQGVGGGNLYRAFILTLRGYYDHPELVKYGSANLKAHLLSNTLIGLSGPGKSAEIQRLIELTSKALKG